MSIVLSCISLVVIRKVIISIVVVTGVTCFRRQSINETYRPIHCRLNEERYHFVGQMSVDQIVFDENEWNCHLVFCLRLILFRCSGTSISGATTLGITTFSITTA
jgi:hypothetical protein